ncbi:pseudouridine synthase [Afipia sp. Root123D2]|uniref:pseudouridine synthase n=1 Tax=Afipia sp. Root123D2 TaxID=1736436 RepID=UPI0006FCCADC|nr:pseudouridine synthase [Afipia sp. Root123D2]KQW21136.1 pseudouridine synthase [Afipia sp. Root123D2]
MPRDNDKNNGRPPRRDGGAGGGKGRPGGAGSRGAGGRGAGGRGGAGARGGERSSAPRGDRKFGDKKFGDKKFGDKKPYAARSSGDKPYAGKRDSFRKDDDRGASRPRFNRDDRPQRDDRGPRKEFGARSAGPRGEGRSFKPREDRGEGRSFKPREDRGEGRSFKPREDRGEGRPFKPREDRGEGRPFKPREDRGERSFKPREDRGGGDRPFKSRGRDDAPRGAGAARSGDRKFGDKKPYAPRGDRGDARPARFNRDDRPQRDERGPRKEFGARSAGPRDEGRSFKPREDRGPRKDFGRGEDRGSDKPWQKRGPAREGASDRPRFSRDRDERSSGADRGPRKFDRPREDRGGSEERSRFSRPRFDKPREERAPRRSEWQEHPRSEGPDRDDRPRRDNEDDSKVFARRPAFGGRGAYRERKPDFDKRTPREAPAKKKTGERIAKLVSRAGMCSRRDAEEWIVQGRVAVNGRVINSPALDVTANDVVTVDGEKLPERERTRLFLYHKPRGLMTTHDDPEGRPTVFDNLPEGLPRLISIGRLDFNTEGLLLLTNDGGLARALELPDTGWLRRYRVRAHGEVTQAQLDQLKNGIEVDGVKYGSIDATLEHDKGANVWIVFAIREGKNREVRNVMAHLGLEVNRLIRISYGPFQLAEIEEGQAEEVKTRVLREQLGDRIVALSGAEFGKPVQDVASAEAKPAKPPRPKRAVIADRKGRSVVVQRTGSDEARARNEDAAAGYGPPRRPKRGYHGKRDLKPKD